MRLPWQRKSGRLEDWPWTGSGPPAELLSLGFGLSDDQAVGLPAFFAVQRLVSHSVGMIPTMVLRDNGGLHEPARDTWQWDLLHKRPTDDVTPFALKADATASIVGHGNAYLQKIRVGLGTSRARVSDLIVLDPTDVTPVRRGGEVVFDVRRDGRDKETLSSAEIIHVRTFASQGDLEGVAPITAARMALSAGLKRQEFELRHFANDARPGMIVSFPREVDEEQAKRWLKLWNSQHKGVKNAGKASVMGGGAEFKIVPISLADAQFIEATKMTTRQVANIYQVPGAFFEGNPGERDWLFFTTFAIGPIITALDQALSADEDLFPQADGLFAEHMPDALLRMDTPTKYQAYKAARQGGWLMPNEIRRKENLPPAEGGDTIQVTPVGGAPNPGDPATATASADMDYEELVDTVNMLAARLKAAEDALEAKQPRTPDGRFAGTGGGGSSSGSGSGSGTADLAAERQAGAEKAANLLINNGGFSLRGSDLGQGKTDGFIVSVSGSEKVLPSLKAATPEAILAYHDANAAKLKADPSLMVGGWHDKTSGKVYLDMSRKFDNKADAVSFGKENGQLAIWDGKAGTEIRLDGKADSLTAEQQIAKLRAQHSNPVQFPLGEVPSAE